MENTEQNDLLVIVNESGLEQQTGLTLQESFLPLFKKAEEWKNKANEIVVTDISQTREMKMAREARLALKDIRVNADKKRKELKEDSLKYGKAVQSVYNLIESLISPIEKHLEDQEKFAEREEAKRREELKRVRESELSPYSEFVPYTVDVVGMPEDDYQKLLSGVKLMQADKIAKEEQAEKERIEREKKEYLLQQRMTILHSYSQFYDPLFGILSIDTTDAEWESIFNKMVSAKKEYAEQQEKIRVENERLKAEAEERDKKEKERLAEIEAQRAKEKQEYEDNLKKEREASEKRESELREQQRLAKEQAERENKILEEKLKAKQDAEKAEQERKEREDNIRIANERKASLAPDKDKLISLSVNIDNFVLPDVSSEEAKKVLTNVKELLKKVCIFINDKAESL